MPVGRLAKSSPPEAETGKGAEVFPFWGNGKGASGSF